MARRKYSSVTLSQQAYVDQLLIRFGIDACNPVCLLLNPNTKLLKAQDGDDHADIPKYHHIIPKSTLTSAPCLGFRSRVTLGSSAPPVLSNCSKSAPPIRTPIHLWYNITPKARPRISVVQPKPAPVQLALFRPNCSSPGAVGAGILGSIT